MGLGLGAGEFQHRVLGAAALHHGKLEMAGQADFECIDADFPIALHTMAVAGGKQSTLVENGQEQRGTLGQFLIVEIAANGARFLGVHHAPFGRRRHAHHAKKGCQRQIKPAILRPEGQAAGHGLLIHRNMQRAAIGEIFRQRPEKRAEAAKAPIRAEFDLFDIHPQSIAGLSAAHFHGAGDDMRAEPRQFSVNFRNRGVQLQALFRPRHHFRPARDAFQNDGLARGNARHRCEGSIKPAPTAGSDRSGDPRCLRHQNVLLI